uniref:Uncharacterized protein n=1 Tax=Tetranychus urticae TaxID=32264 RepID=T1KWY3_TETUR
MTKYQCKGWKTFILTLQIAFSRVLGLTALLDWVNKSQLGFNGDAFWVAKVIKI